MREDEKDNICFITAPIYRMNLSQVGLAAENLTAKETQSLLGHSAWNLFLDAVAQDKVSLKTRSVEDQADLQQWIREKRLSVGRVDTKDDTASSRNVWMDRERSRSQRNFECWKVRLVNSASSRAGV